MGHLRVFILLLPAAAGLLGLNACSDSKASPPPASRTGGATLSGDAVVAEVNGESITAADLDQAAATALARIRQEEYDIRRQHLNDMIAERLIEAEAEKRGVSVEELLEKEVRSQTPMPDEASVQTIYERNRNRFGSQSRSEALARIEEALFERAIAEGELAYERTLIADADVTVHLDPPRVAIDIPDDARGTGPESAPVTIVEFTDYQCPYCHRAQEVIDQILEEYSGQVRLVHLDFPLDNHTGAIPAARAARCAGEQGRFWDYHRSLMSEPGSLDETDLARRARALDLNAGEFDTCVASDRHDADIRAEMNQGSRLGVTGTPAYFINGRLVSGARPFPHFAEVIDDELAGD